MHRASTRNKRIMKSSPEIDLLRYRDAGVQRCILNLKIKGECVVDVFLDVEWYLQSADRLIVGISNLRRDVEHRVAVGMRTEHVGDRQIGGWIEVNIHLG